MCGNVVFDFLCDLFNILSSSSILPAKVSLLFRSEPSLPCRSVCVHMHAVAPVWRPEDELGGGSWPSALGQVPTCSRLLSLSLLTCEFLVILLPLLPMSTGHLPEGRRFYLSPSAMSRLHPDELCVLST